jgi:hypothetical protein
VEAPRHNDKPNRTPCQRQISQTPKISTVNTLGARSAPWTRARFATVADRNQGQGAITCGAHDIKARRDQGRRTKGFLHDVEFLCETNESRHSHFIKIESEPKLDADQGQI